MWDESRYVWEQALHTTHSCHARTCCSCCCFLAGFGLAFGFAAALGGFSGCGGGGMALPCSSTAGGVRPTRQAAPSARSSVRPRRRCMLDGKSGDSHSSSLSRQLHLTSIINCSDVVLRLGIG